MKDKITELNEFIEKTNMKNYPIGNALLEEETDYIKNSYFKMLAVVLQQGDEVSPAQSNIFMRLIEGAGGEADISDYLRQALGIEIESYVDFTEQCREMPLKYRFLLDSMILCISSEPCEEQIKLVSGFAESLKVNMNEVRYLAMLGKSIVGQDSEIYASAENIRPNFLNYEWFLEYTELYVTGTLCQTETQLFIQAVEKQSLDIGILLNGDSSTIQLTQDNICFKNIIVDLSDITLKFVGNEEVRFENCEFIGNQYSISFTSAKKVTIRNSTFRNFNSRTIEEDEIKCFVIEGCSFIDCMYHYHRYASSWMELGGVIYTENRERNAINIISDTQFKNCGGKNGPRGYCSSAIISNCYVEVNNCSFYNCWNYNDNNIDFDDPHRTLFIDNMRGDGNKIIGSANLTYESEKTGIFLWKH